MRLFKDASAERAGSVILILTELLALTITKEIVTSPQLNHAFDYGASCTVDYQCDATSFVTCNMETLRCDCVDGTKWNFELQKCLRMEGWSCNTKHGANCTVNSSCVAGKCVCDDDYLPNGSGLCQLTYDMPCSDGPRNCSWQQYLVCPKSYFSHQERRCRCIKEGINFTWDDTKKKCVALAGSECDLDYEINSAGIECTENAFCNYDGVCHCRKGYSITKEKTCMLKFGEKCNNARKEFCNKYDFLNCLDGKCNCEFFMQMKYDESVGKCRLLSGEPCGWPINASHGRGKLTANSTHFTRNGLDDRIHTCVQGAVCVARTEHGRGVCACVDGKREAADKTCEEIPFGNDEEDFEILKAFPSSSPCTDLPSRGNSVVRGCFTINPSKRLSCSVESGTAVCGCGEGAFFNGSDCINFPGQNCIGSDRSNQCAANSFCDATEGVCKCFEHFRLETESSSCKPVYVKSKSVNSVLASSEVQNVSNYTGQNNISDGSCTTLNNELDRMKCFCEMLGPLVFWSEAGRLCIGMVGAPCKNNTNVNFLCIENSQCDLVDGSCQCEDDYYQTEMDVCLFDDGMGINYIDYSDEDDHTRTEHSQQSLSASYAIYPSFSILLFSAYLLMFPALFNEIFY